MHSPDLKRFAPEALGINVMKTTEHAGMPISWPAAQNTERIAVLLID